MTRIETRRLRRRLVLGDDTLQAAGKERSAAMIALFARNSRAAAAHRR